jgi:bidirectional [NiFe] hydrogenase diaphorase subunit
MSEVALQIDGRVVKSQRGATVLEAARSAGISIPTLCYHEKLEPYGGCRLCTVEVEARGSTRLVAACLYPVEQDLTVRTRSKKIDKIRKLILELLLAHAPMSEELRRLAAEYGADQDRFEKEPNFCILSGGSTMGRTGRYVSSRKSRRRNAAAAGSASRSAQRPTFRPPSCSSTA